VSMSCALDYRAHKGAFMTREEMLVEALQWCSAASDFQCGGAARVGWVKMCAHCCGSAYHGPPTPQVQNARTVVRRLI